MCLITQHTIRTYWDGGTAQRIVNLDFDRDKWSASPFGIFTSGTWATATQWTEGWVGHRESLKALTPARNQTSIRWFPSLVPNSVRAISSPLDKKALWRMFGPKKKFKKKFIKLRNENTRPLHFKAKKQED
jgi:hypothetical protein